MQQVVNLMFGDCLQRMKDIPDHSVDLILTDPPYGQVKCAWDVVIPFEQMWAELDRVIKPNGAVVLFGCEPFSSLLRVSNINNYKYDWVWEKTSATGFFNAKKQPLRAHENILVFYKKQCTYNPQKTHGHAPVNSFTKTLEVANNSEIYGKSSKVIKGGGNTDRYPRTVQIFKSDKQLEKYHPTQKPVDLLEYLVNTYTNPNETVLDFTMGSGSTGIACLKTNRNFIGIELDENYFNVSKERITKHADSYTLGTKPTICCS